MRRPIFRRELVVRLVLAAATLSLAAAGLVAEVESPVPGAPAQPGDEPNAAAAPPPEDRKARPGHTRRAALPARSTESSEPIRSPVANDFFADAMEITSLPFQHELDAADATVETGDATACGDAPRDGTVWYRMRPERDIDVSLKLHSADFAFPRWGVYTGDTLASLRVVECSDEPVMGSLDLTFSKGSTYYVQVRVQWDWTEFFLNVWLQGEREPDPPHPPPPNDDFADATGIVERETIGGGIDGATREPGEPENDCAPRWLTVWFRFIPDESSEIDVEYDDEIDNKRVAPLQIAIYEGDALSSLRVTACGAGGTAFDAVEGRTYFIQVGLLEETDVRSFDLELKPAVCVPGNDECVPTG